MSVTINAKGTSVSTFRVGKAGTLITQSGTIEAPPDSDLRLSVNEDQFVVIDSGNTGPALITASNNQDLHINPAVDGGRYLYLNQNRWPAADGYSGQALVTDGNGLLTFSNISGTGGWDSGSGSALYPEIHIVSGNSQTAENNRQYVITNTSSSTTITFPAIPVAGDIIWVTNTTSRTDHSINNNGALIQGLDQPYVIQANITVQLRYINISVGWRII